MAFQTIRGESGIDFVGTDTVDVLFALNETGLITVEAKDGNDSITIADNTAAVGTVTVKGGAGNDVILATDVDGATSARFSNSDIKGGLGNDTITSAGAVSSKLRGNEGDDNFALTGNYTDTTIAGNAGSDSFTVATSIALSNTKIVGGSNNDGVMNFSSAVAADGISAAVDSTINGSKGVDNITIGQVTTASNFTIFGGQDGDTITSANNGADGITYSGDKGDDVITMTGAAKASILGGDGNDNLTGGTDADTIDGGEGNDRISGGTGADSMTGGAGDDTFTNGTGNDTIIGGAGADTYTPTAVATEANKYVLSSVSESAAATTGTTVTFDSVIAGGNTFGAAEILDITAFDQNLIGDSVASGAGNQVSDGNAIANFTTVSTFDQLKTQIDALPAGFGLRSSGVGVVAGGVAQGVGAGQMSIQTITIVDDAAVTGTFAGTFVIVNNNNTVLDSGDLMFQIGAGSLANQAGFTAAIENAY